MIEVDQIELMGALVYRTRQALVSPALEKGENKYLALVNAGKTQHSVENLYYYPGTYEEIKNAFDIQNRAVKDLRFPSVISYQQVTEEISLFQTIHYELAIITASNQEWTTEQREVSVFQPVLTPIYNELIKQIKSCGWFDLGTNEPSYTKTKVFTTGNQLFDISKDLFGDSVDFIRIRNLKLKVKNSLCQDDLARINEEYQKVYQ